MIIRNQIGIIFIVLALLGAGCAASLPKDLRDGAVAALRNVIDILIARIIEGIIEGLSDMSNPCRDPQPAITTR